jgi:site-specific recombinase XerD
MQTDRSIRQLVTQYLSEKDFSDTTLVTYSYVLHYFFTWLAKNNLPIRQPSRSDIIRWKRELKASGKSTCTIDLYIVSLKGFFNWLEDLGIYSNIIKNVRIETRHKQFKKKILAPDQVKQLMQSIPSETIIDMRDRALINLIYTCGLRRIEAHRLNMSDLTDTTIAIQGKGYQDKVKVAIGDQAFNLISDYLHARLNNGEDVNDKSPVFLSHRSNATKPIRINPRTISYIVRQRLDQAALLQKGISVHSLRHSAAVSLIETGHTLYEVSVFLRHSSTDTARIYTRYIEEKIAAEKRPQNVLQQGIL